jgi:hypothetical protein
MTRVLALLVVLSPLASLAQTYLACSTSCPSRYYWETAVPTTRAAPSATPVDGTVGSGMKLPSVTGAFVSLCAASGQTLSGAGSLAAYYYDPAAALWMRDPDLDLDVDLTATSCGGSPCRCRVWPDFPVPANKAGYVLFATDGITVSGGTLTVRIGGSL